MLLIFAPQMAEIGSDILKAKQLLEAREIVAIPTETVYGLAGHALEEESILKIYAAKNRPKFDPLIAHTDSIHKIDSFVTHIPEKARLIADHFWPGPITVLLDRNHLVPDLLTSGLSRVAVRIPNHHMTLDLLNSLDFPLAAPSANPFGYVSPTTADHVQQQMGDRVSYILDGGACRIGLESTIVGFENDDVVVYRLGGTRVEDLNDLFGEVKLQVNESSNPAAPGMLKSHYSPGRPMLMGEIEKNLNEFDPNEVGVISFKTRYSIPESNQAILSESGDLEEAARNIFSALRKMDQKHIKMVLAEFVPNVGLGRAINDRLRRAAA